MNLIVDRESRLVAELETLDISDADAYSWGPDDAYLAGIAREGLVIWNAKNGRIVRVLERVGDAPHIWSRGGQLLLQLDGGWLARWNQDAGLVLISMSTEGEVKAEVKPFQQP